jgi:transcription antitermination factor NusG
MNSPAIKVNDIATHVLNSRENPRLPAEYSEPHWYAVYTLSNHEKCVQGQLEQRSVESFLPLYETLRRWKDRKVRLQLPLFPGYLFVRIPLCDRLRVLQIPSVVRLVGFNGTPVALPEEEMRALRNGLAQGICAEPWPYLTSGRRVRIVRGPLYGMQGTLLRKKNQTRVVITLDLIRRSVVVEVDIVDIHLVRSGPLLRCESAFRKVSHSVTNSED